MEAGLVKFGLGKSFDEIAGTLGFNGKESFSVGELADEVGMHDKVAEIHGEELEGRERFMSQEGTMSVCIQAREGLLSNLAGFEKFASS